MPKIFLIFSIVTISFFIFPVFADTEDLKETIPNYTTYHTPQFSITVPSGLIYNYDEENKRSSWDSDNVFIEILSHFPDGVIEDRDEHLDMMIKSNRDTCESKTMEKDGFQCSYELFDSYKTVLNGNPVLIVYNQYNYKESIDSPYDDSFSKCYDDTVIATNGVWILQGCTVITNKQAAQPFMGLGEVMVDNLLREAMNTFDPFDKFSLPISKLIETYGISVSPFVDPSQSPQYYVDRYNNEPNYRAWFDKNYPDMTIYAAVGYPNQIVNEFSSKKIPQVEENYPIKEDVNLKTKQKIPEWVKEVFTFYSNGQIGDDELIQAIQFLIKEGIIKV